MTHPIRVLLVDDQPTVRHGIRLHLSCAPDIEIAGEAGDGATGVELASSLAADVVVLDIAMPGLTGIDIARLVDKFKTPPQIIFVTAHDQHAVEAFDLNAVDYLLKPIREERLRESVRRAVADAIHPPENVVPFNFVGQPAKPADALAKQG